LAPIGACRTCLVEADGRVIAACSIPAASVREVQTTTDRVRRLRRGVLELTAGMQRERLSGGPVSTHTADTITREAADRSRFILETNEHRDSSNSFFTFDEAACILCGRCVVACQALQHISAIGMAGSGRTTRVTPGADLSFRDSICTSCGSCVAACPTTALAPKMEVNP
ncbi:MAG: 4Fe-4S dicluster domain-containing protein, partial [Tepidiformaceae bacterium]